MNEKIIEAVISYAGITIAAASVGVIGGLVVVSQEVEPAWYKAVAGVWPKLDGTVQQEVASAMSGGYISRWESMALNERILGHVMVYQAFDPADRRPKEQLKALVEAVK